MPSVGADIRSLNISELEPLLKKLGQPKFRAAQLIRWLYVADASSYEDMTNLPATLRSALAEQRPLAPLVCIDKQISRDGTRKYVFEYADKTRVEAVGMPADSPGATGAVGRLADSPDAKGEAGMPADSPVSKKAAGDLSVCLSTQAGCAMNCAFCATGKEGLVRNLSSGEIVSQVLAVQKDFGRRVSRVVAMGQGEPFQNYDAVLEALRFINAKQGLGIGARHITVSTCGLLSGIDKLSHEPEQFTLAVSLHAARQRVRDYLMPRCKNMPLDRLKSALLSYVQRTGRRVSLEYLLIKETNDQPEDLAALLHFCDGLHCHINLIPLNAVQGSAFQPSPTSTQSYWVKRLSKHGHETTIRNSRGKDIAGACGQLKNQLSC